MALFREQYPDIEVRETLFAIDRNRITCAGGVATLDMMLPPDRQPPRPRRWPRSSPTASSAGASATTPSRSALSAQHAPASPTRRLAGIVHDDGGASRDAADRRGSWRARAGISVRQLERLMRDTLGETPSRYYLKLRLQAARNHLFYGDMPIQDVAAACGFSGPEVFSRSFRSHFGLSPREFRQQFTRDQLRRFRPELDQQLVA